MPSVDPTEATASESIDVFDAETQARKEAYATDQRLSHLIATGQDLSADEIAKARAKAVVSEGERKSTKLGKELAYGLTEAVKALGKGIYSESDPVKSSYHKNYVKKNETLINTVLSRLDKRSSNYSLVAKALADALKKHGTWAETASIDQLINFLVDEAKKVETVDTANLDKLNDDLQKFNSAMKDAMMSDGKLDGTSKGILKEKDDMLKYRFLQFISLATPFGFFSIFDYLDPLAEIFGLVFDGTTSVAEGVASTSTASFLGPLGKLMEMAKVDKVLQWTFENTPVVAQLFDLVDALTDNQIAQGIGETVGPGIVGSPLTGIGIAYVFSIFRTSAEINHYKKVNSFLDAEDKKVKDVIDATIAEQKKLHESGGTVKVGGKDVSVLGATKLAEQMFNINKKRNVDVELISCLSNLRWSAKNRPTETKALFDKVFAGVKFKDGGADKDLWTLMEEKKLNACEAINEFLNNVPAAEDASKNKLRTQFLLLSGMLEAYKKEGYFGELLEKKVLERFDGVTKDADKTAKFKAEAQALCDQKFVARLADKYQAKYSQDIIEETDGYAMQYIENSAFKTIESLGKTKANIFGRDFASAVAAGSASLVPDILMEELSKNNLKIAELQNRALFIEELRSERKPIFEELEVASSAADFDFNKFVKDKGLDGEFDAMVAKRAKFVTDQVKIARYNEEVRSGKYGESVSMDNLSDLEEAFRSQRSAEYAALESLVKNADIKAFEAIAKDPATVMTPTSAQHKGGLTAAVPNTVSATPPIAKASGRA